MTMGSFENDQIIEILIKFGADIDNENDLGETPLCIAAKYNNLLAIRTLSYYACNINYVLKTGKFEGGTVLHMAASSSNVETMILLIELGGNFVFKDWRGRLPVHWAAREGKVEVLNLLLDLLGGDMYIEDHGGLTLLHLAAAGGNTATVNYLLRENFDIEAKDITGSS